ncbi:type II CRISPR RNA-guided endonuclease Cas9 [Lactobacillus helveticus]|uniref:CRISPR-associated endonuclease Cas9 n=1 Tax=Lactobacillus helveticus TaxID=1587 RepID=A0A9Q5C5W3_LACHE|nr:type II CRISPR RNA-guided endonuclease Cas9 [Lactobacillus helveticus]NRO22238.1 CRISPR-associated endonuclease Cas9 2 [Lactobacillus helveticus]NRO34925.1 CRISPR-associated endonuclease Cas9 2 [Lactobacillus helveticus]
MSKIDKDYIAGLDIGTNSCGWVATDLQNNILKMHGKTAIGSHLFEEGTSAADRRGFRTTRRRIKRRKWRLHLLEEIFDPYMAKVDPYFFARLKESGLSPLDKKKKSFSIIFPTKSEEQEYYKDKHHTIYHLRNALMKENQRFDLREVFLAIHHIVKYRGNFLQDTPVKDFNASKIDVKITLENLNKLFSDVSEEYSVEFAVENVDKIETILRDDNTFKLDKSRQISKLLVEPSKNKDENKLRKDIARQVANAILGYKTKFEDILLVDIDKDEKSNWEFKLSDSDADEKVDQIITALSDTQQEVISEIRNLFSAITLSGIVDEGKTLSESMIRKYKDHQKDVDLLKKIIKNHPDKDEAKRLSLAYDLYVNNRYGHVLEAKKVLKSQGIKTNKTLTKEDFYSLVKKNLDESKEAKEILNKIALDSFMPKQRTNENGVIPFQLHQIELDKIIANQSKYYPFLAEKNPVESHRSQAPYKLDELVRFRVPYYVGPMIQPKETKDQQVKQNQNFAWMVRKEKGQIRPWNFDQKVNRMESANHFIKRMTTKDTYLLGEDVLPANSLLYQKFMVLNELNNIRINNRRISVAVKQNVYNDLFMNKATVNTKNLVDYLKQKYRLPSVEIKGLADPKKFNSGLTVYNKLKNTNLFDVEIADSKYLNDFERIIEWSTIFEDKAIYKAKLQTINWLDDKQIRALVNIRLQGWGRLSKKLLAELHDKNGQTIMEQLWDSQKNFMRIVNEPDFKAEIASENQAIVKNTSIEDFLTNAYTSPANKKAIRQVIKVVDDIVKAASGKAPKQIAIEFARDADRSKRTVGRGARLLNIYEKITDDLITTSLKESLKQASETNQFIHDKIYLYFMQGGRDAYTGKPINIDEVITGYQLDHILPQSFIKNDSLDNRVLVSSPVNNDKSDHVPAKMFGNKMAAGLGITISDMWKKWLDLGLISKRKYQNLKLDPDHINKYQASGFINRQLVETSQIIKLVATILQARYPDTEILVVKASSNHYLRKHFHLYKSREVNDYHHAIDAYLSTICGNLLYQAYPKLRPFFVYGQYQKFSKDPEKESKVLDSLRHFNFISNLLKQRDSKIRAGQSGVVIFDRNKIKEQLQRAYNFKYMLVSRETSTRNQRMFQMTLYPRADRDTAKSRNLIPKGKNMPTEIYGGYTGNSDAYLAIVRINKKKSVEYKVVGVPMRALERLNKTKNYNEELKRVLEPTILFNDKGKRKAPILSFDIVKGRVPYKQVVIDGDRKFMLGSSTYVYNAKQLTLSWKAMQVITDNLESDKYAINRAYIDVFDEILEKLDKYLPLFDINKFREKLHLGRDKFIKLSIAEKRETILQILNGLHDNPVMPKIKNLGLTTPLGFMQFSGGITLSKDAVLIYQSPTGLFEKRIKVSKL